MSTEAILGCVIGVLALVVMILFLTIMLMSDRAEKQQNTIIRLHEKLGERDIR